MRLGRQGLGWQGLGPDAVMRVRLSAVMLKRGVLLMCLPQQQGVLG